MVTVGIIAAHALADGAIGLLLPRGPNSDAAKLHRCAWASMRGRGRRDAFARERP